jgi:hypothetical protein
MEHPIRIKSRVPLICCLALASAGCSGSTEWWRDTASSDCLCPADAAECGASDCALVNVRGLSSDGTYVQGVVRVSESRQSMTVVQMFRGEYKDLGDSMRFTPDTGKTFSVSVERDGEDLLINNVIQTHPPEWLTAALQNNSVQAR